MGQGDEWRWADPTGQQRLVRLDELRAGLASGRIPPNAPVWRTGWLQWCPAHDVPELSSGAFAAMQGLVPSVPPPPLDILASQKAFEQKGQSWRPSGTSEVASPSLDSGAEDVRGPTEPPLPPRYVPAPVRASRISLPRISSPALQLGPLPQGPSAAPPVDPLTSAPAPPEPLSPSLREGEGDPNRRASLVGTPSRPSSPLEEGVDRTSRTSSSSVLSSSESSGASAIRREVPSAVPSDPRLSARKVEGLFARTLRISDVPAQVSALRRERGAPSSAPPEAAGESSSLGTSVSGSSGPPAPTDRLSLSERVVEAVHSGGGEGQVSSSSLGTIGRGSDAERTLATPVADPAPRATESLAAAKNPGATKGAPPAERGRDVPEGATPEAARASDASQGATSPEGDKTQRTSFAPGSVPIPSSAAAKSGGGRASLPSLVGGQGSVLEVPGVRASTDAARGPSEDRPGGGETREPAAAPRPFSPFEGRTSEAQRSHPSGRPSSSEMGPLATGRGRSSPSTGSTLVRPPRASLAEPAGQDKGGGSNPPGASPSDRGPRPSSPSEPKFAPTETGSSGRVRTLPFGDLVRDLELRGHGALFPLAGSAASSGSPGAKHPSERPAPDEAKHFSSTLPPGPSSDIPSISVPMGTRRNLFGPARSLATTTATTPVFALPSRGAVSDEGPLSDADPVDSHAATQSVQVPHVALDPMVRNDGPPSRLSEEIPLASIDLQSLGQLQASPTAKNTVTGAATPAIEGTSGRSPFPSTMRPPGMSEAAPSPAEEPVPLAFPDALPVVYQERDTARTPWSQPWFKATVGLLGTAIVALLGVGLYRRAQDGKAEAARKAEAVRSSAASPAPAEEGQPAPPCGVAGASTVLASKVVAPIGLEVVAHDGTAFIAFAEGAHEGVLTEWGLDEGRVVRVSKGKFPGTLRRVSVVGGGKTPPRLSLEGDRKGDLLAERRSVPPLGQWDLGLASSPTGPWVSMAAHGSSALARLWPIPEAGGKGTPPPTVRAVTFQDGVEPKGVVVLKSGPSFSLGAFRITPDGVPSAMGEWMPAGTLGAQVGTPSVAAGPETAIVAWAERASASVPWTLRKIVWRPPMAPSEPSAIAVHEQDGDGGAMAPVVSSVPGGGFLVVWTQGPVASHEVWSATLDARGRTQGTPFRVSALGVNAGQGQGTVGASGKGVIVYLTGRKRTGFSVEAVPIVCVPR